MKKTIIPVPIQVAEGAQIPAYASADASGADIRAYIENEILLLPGTSVAVASGLRIAVPVGYELQVRPRSGLAMQYQVTVLNTPGTIDADYRGEIAVILINHGKEIFVVTPGMRIAQLVFAPVVYAQFTVEVALTTTARGEGRFGHTGTH